MKAETSLISSSPWRDMEGRNIHRILPENWRKTNGPLSLSLSLQLSLQLSLSLSPLFQTDLVGRLRRLGTWVLVNGCDWLR